MQILTPSSLIRRTCSWSLDTGAVPTACPGRHGQSSTSTSTPEDAEDEDEVESSDIIDDEEDEDGKPSASFAGG